jgi:hypothetical protein
MRLDVAQDSSLTGGQSQRARPLTEGPSHCTALAVQHVAWPSNVSARDPVEPQPVPSERDQIEPTQPRLRVDVGEIRDIEIGAEGHVVGIPL